MSHAKEVNQYPPADRVKEFDTEGRRLIQIWDQLMVKEGVLYRMFIGRGNYESYLQLIVPQILGETVLAELHEGSTEGHLGQEKTLDKLKEYFYWPLLLDQLVVQCVPNISPAFA